MRHFRSFCLAGAAGLALASAASAQSGIAPGAPGDLPTWSSAAKTGAGASYEAYVDGQYRDGDHLVGFDGGVIHRIQTPIPLTGIRTGTIRIQESLPISHWSRPRP